jgi:hypothetical protein
MHASHWIPQELLESIDDLEKLELLAKKFSKHYPNDRELVGVCREIKRYVKKPGRVEKKEIKSKLERLVKLRQIGGSGGTGLWYKNVRKLANKGKMR